MPVIKTFYTETVVNIYRKFVSLGFLEIIKVDPPSYQDRPLVTFNNSITNMVLHKYSSMLTCSTYPSGKCNSLILLFHSEVTIKLIYCTYNHKELVTEATLWSSQRTP